MLKPAIHSAAQVVLLFLKNPEKGRVKTRLAVTIGQDAATRLYQSFVGDTLSMLKRTRRPVIICFHPPCAEAAVTRWLGGDYRFWPQIGADLGERISNAFVRAFSEKHTQVLLMGTDVPGLPEGVIREAFDALVHRPAVLGPSMDGGYYLIGFNEQSFSPRCFQNILWSTPAVFRQTLERMPGHAQAFHILPEWRDIDDCEDLKDLVSRQDALRDQAPSTLACLSSLGLLPPVSKRRAVPGNASLEFD